MTDENNNGNKFNYINFLKKNKIKFIILSSIILLFIFIIIILKELEKKEISQISQEYNRAKIILQNNDKQKAKKIFLSIINKKDNFYAPSSLNLIIENDLVEDYNEILILYDKIINETKLDKDTKNLFIIKKTIFIGDKIKEDELLNTLNPIIQSSSMWKRMAMEYIKNYYISRKEFNKAQEFDLKIK